MSVRLKQEGKPTIYTFEKEWVNDVLAGDHFLSDICLFGKVNIREETTRVDYDEKNAIWTVAGTEHDPDFLFYLWKKGSKTSTIYIKESELLSLYQFYKKNGFTMMLKDLDIKRRICTLL